MTDTYTQADLDRIVKEAVDYASQAAAQEARAAALQEAAEWHKEVITHDRGGLDYASAVGIPISNADDLRASVAIHEYALNRILALLDTPAAEALERVRQGEREACAKVADEFHEAAMKWAAVHLKTFDGETDSKRIAAAIRARGEAP